MSKIYLIYLRGALFYIALTLGTIIQTNAGFLYVLNDNAANENRANAVYGYSVNETTGALTLLNGFPVFTDGIGISTAQNRLAVDSTNNRLYVINGNANSHSVSAYSINASTGALTSLPFSPIVLPAIGNYFTIAVHPSGSPLIVGNTFDSTNNTTGNNSLLVYNVTATTATPVAGNPVLTGNAAPNSSEFSRDGKFFYTGGDTGTDFAGFNVNATTGVLTALAGSPFNSGNARPLGLSTDSQGRIFLANFLGTNTNDDLRVFTTTNGVPTAATLNPFGSMIRQAVDGKLSPNESYYVVADRVGNQVGSYQIVGNGATTALVALTRVASSGVDTNALAFNMAGTFLYATNNESRNITTYAFNATNGMLTFNNVQLANSLGAKGRVTGIKYIVPKAVSTAAGVTISGKVIAGKRGVPRVTVSLTGANGIIRRTETNVFGNYSFENIAAGETYIFDVKSKRYTFAVQVLTITENRNDLNFVGN